MADRGLLVNPHLGGVDDDDESVAFPPLPCHDGGGPREPDTGLGSLDDVQENPAGCGADRPVDRRFDRAWVDQFPVRAAHLDLDDVDGVVVEAVDSSSRVRRCGPSRLVAEVPAGSGVDAATADLGRSDDDRCQRCIAPGDGGGNHLGVGTRRSEDDSRLTRPPPPEQASACGGSLRSSRPPLRRVDPPALLRPATGADPVRRRSCVPSGPMRCRTRRQIATVRASVRCRTS